MHCAQEGKSLHATQFHATACQLQKKLKCGMVHTDSLLAWHTEKNRVFASVCVMHCQLPGTKAPHGSKGTHKCIARLSQIEHRHPCMDGTYSCTCDLLPACVSALACVMHCQLPSAYCTRHCRMNRFMLHVTAYAIDALPAAKYQSIAWCSLLTLSCQEDTQLQYLVGTQFAYRYRRLGALEIVKSFPNRCVSTSRLTHESGTAT